MLSDGPKEAVVRQFILGGLAAALATGGLIGSAPRPAGCVPAAPFAINKCDGPVQPDGTWQRCVTFQQTAGSLPSYLTTTNCQTLGPDAHIDGQTTHWPVSVDRVTTKSTAAQPLSRFSAVRGGSSTSIR